MTTESVGSAEWDYARFAQVPSRAELERCFFLDDEDLRLVGRRRGDHNRVGFGLQLGTVRYLGLFLADPTDVPTPVVDYVAEQVGAADPSCVKRYLARRTTRFEHAAEIADAFGYRDFDTAVEELGAWIDDRAWTTGDGPTALQAGAIAWLRERRILLPGPSTLRRLVGHTRDAATQRLWDALSGRLTAGQAAALESLLTVPDGARVSALERLRQGPTAASGKAMVAALDRIDEVSGLGVDPGTVAVVPARRVTELARWGMSGKAPALRRHPSSRRLATLLATVVQLQAKATDDALELFDVLMANDLMARAQRQSKADTLRRYPRLSRDAAICAAAAAVLLDAAESDGDVSIASVWHAIEQVVSRKDLVAAVAGITAVTPPPDADPGGAWRASIVERYAVVRRFLPQMCAVIDFGSTPAAGPILTAFQGLPVLMAAKPTRGVPAGYLAAADVDLDVVPAGWWQPLVQPAGRPAGTVPRSAYVFAVLEQFHQALRRRDIHTGASTRWADPQAKLLTGSAWVQARRPVLNALQLPETADGLLADQARALDGSWRGAAGRLGSGDASIDPDGRLHTAKLDAIPDPPSLIDLRARCQAMLPRVDVADVILEVMAWQPGFVDAFTAVSGGRTRLADLHLSVAAALTAHALNIGFTPVVSSGVAALTRDRISHVDQNYLRTETYAAANAPLIDAQADIDLAQIWGGGLVAAVDGIRFVVPVRSIDARPNPKYFGRGRGATLLNLVNDHAVGIAGMVLSGTPRDSLHVIDLLYRQDGGTRPEVIISDTGAYSDMVFGLLHLLGFDYRPQLADLPDTKLWRIDPAADYGPVNAAARGRIDTDRIAANWSEILRIVASIHTGTVSAHDVIRMLAHGGRPTRVGDALAHYGRTFKTMHVLSYIDDGTYRRQIKTMRNLQEGRHDLARHLFHGRKGQLRESYRQGMEEQMGALGLVLNCITLWNTVYLDAIIKQLRADGYPVDDQDVARLSPYVRRHINVHGHYAFHPRTATALRPLSTADEHEFD